MSSLQFTELPVVDSLWIAEELECQMFLVDKEFFFRG